MFESSDVADFNDESVPMSILKIERGDSIYITRHKDGYFLAEVRHKDVPTSIIISVEIFAEINKLKNEDWVILEEDGQIVEVISQSLSIREEVYTNGIYILYFIQEPYFMSAPNGRKKTVGIDDIRSVFVSR
ncbi:MAG: hypothetical protein KAI57_01690 [Candidatus Pacebacteria bacterium]|nr:hypothetical protein [Candidatus Paceibacterota bacterium]